MPQRLYFTSLTKTGSEETDILTSDNLKYLPWKTTLCQLNLKIIWYQNLNLNSNWKTEPRNPLTFKSYNLWHTKPKNLKQCIDTQNSDKQREPEKKHLTNFKPTKQQQQKKGSEETFDPNPQTEKPNPKKSSDI